LENIQQYFLLRQCLELTVASLIIKRIQRKDLEYLSKNLEKQKEVLLHYNSNTNRKYIHIDNEFHYYLFKICDLEAFWKIISEQSFDFDRLRHISANNKKRCLDSTKEHIKIYNAIKKGSISLLKKAINLHFSNSKKYYRNILKLNNEIIE
jgi:DNA-binding GntR family transcriptional regulator